MKFAHHNPNHCPDEQAKFRQRLLDWYDEHRRDLPWRESRDPYRVWLSEIMLQQTRVAAVIEHYQEFLLRFPTVEKLAQARERSVLAAWSGLGYYRRARMLHAAAKVIARTYLEQFPTTSAEWRGLPGVGRYTAAAIASIAFDEPVAAVDGNVERVLRRLSGQNLQGEILWSAASSLLDTVRPGDFNQAMMELGATVCTPRSPACLTCPVVDLCATRGEVPLPAKAARQRKCEIHYTLDCRDGKVFLVQRARDASLMAGMWELPETVPAVGQMQSARKAKSAGRRSASARKEGANGGGEVGETQRTACLTLRHSITVTDYAVRVWRGTVREEIRGKWVPLALLKRVALTGLARKILRAAEILRAEPTPKRLLRK